MSEKKKISPFNKKPPDRRFVKQVMGFHQGLPRNPDYWTPMDVARNECKLMEVKKFSAHYFEIDTRFRRQGLELISAYVVQNPFLWGQYLLRREQMQAQMRVMKQRVRERELFTPTDFDSFEQVARLNFDIRSRAQPLNGLPFYTDALTANQSHESENVKLMFLSKVLLGMCMEQQTEEQGETVEGETDKVHLHLSSKTGLPIDTTTNEHRNIFYKFNMTEVYPDILLVYRDKSIEVETRTYQLVTRYVKKGLRSGTRVKTNETLAIKGEKEKERPDDPGETSLEVNDVKQEVLGIHKLEEIEVVPEDDIQQKREVAESTKPRRKLSDMFFKIPRKKSVLPKQDDPEVTTTTV